MKVPENFPTSDRPLPLGRRQFLSGTACLAATAAAGSVSRAGAADDNGTDRQVKLGMVGCGGRGLWIGRLFRDHGGYAMHAVADYFPQVADAAGEELGVDASRRFHGLDGYRRLIESGVEAVALETPPYFFPEHVQAAVEAGLHVFLAKPVAVDVPGCRQVEAAARRAAEQQQCFLVDYQMPTDPHVSECARRYREGALGNLSMVKSFYYGGLFGDPPLTDNLADRFRSLIWVNDNALGGSYHVNACIHPVQAMMWVLDQVPVAAAGISRIARQNPHGDSHDMFGITYEFEDGLLWTHTGRHARGLTGPDDPLATCEFLGDAYMKIGYGGQALIRGGSHHYPGGPIENLYGAGATRNIATFYQDILAGNAANPTVPMALASCLATILGREACARKSYLTLDEVLAEAHPLEVDLSGLTR